MARFVMSTDLAAPAARVWDAVRTPGAFRLVTRGLLGLPELRHRTQPWRVGETTTVTVWLFGVLPFSRHYITVTDIDDSARVLRTEERGGPVRTWRHTIAVVSTGGARCRYSDVLDIDAGTLTPIVVWWARRFYRVRQRRWRELAHVIAGASPSQPTPAAAG